MNAMRKALKHAVKRMGTREAKAWIKTFELPEEEESAIIMCDVEGLSLVQASLKSNHSPEVISRYKGLAYDRISREIDEVPA